MIKWNGHALLGRRAYEALPEWEKKLIRVDLSSEEIKRPFMPEGIKTAGDKMGAMCLIMDWVYHNQYRNYALYKKKRWLPHTPAAEDFSAAFTAGKPVSWNATAILVRNMLKTMVSAIRKHDWEETIRRGGVLGHFIQEPYTPGHAIDNSILAQIFPDPDPGRHIRLHAVFDRACDRFKPLPPHLLGCSIDEAVFRIIVEMQWAVRKGREKIVPVIQSAYRDEPEYCQEEILKEEARGAAFLTSSAWHTAFCIALDRFDFRETENLKSIRLIDMFPIFFHPNYYSEVLPGCLVENKRKKPIHVWEQKPCGKKQEILVENGFGMYGHAGIKYFIDGNIYNEFHCRLGLPSRVLEGQTERTNVIFSVETDSNENQVYSEDMEYGAKRILELSLRPGEPLQEIRVPLNGAKTLILCARSFPYLNEDKTTEFSIPHIAICEPEMRKTLEKQ